MKRIRSWLTHLALRTPIITGLRERADSAIREARAIEADAEKSMELMGEELRYQRMRMSERMREMMDLRLAEMACRDPQRAQEFAEAWSAAPAGGPAQFKERMWELELALEDRGWQREQALASLEFSRYGVGQLIRICRIMALKNPLIKRGAEICALYVFGRGLEIRSKNERINKVIQEFLKRNDDELCHIGLANKETSAQTDGGLYFGLKTSTTVDLQMIDPLEIMDVITDPDDTSKDWYYRRQWMRNEIASDGHVQAAPMEAYYPACSVVMDPPPGFVQLKELAGKPVNWEMPIHRVKIGAPAKWRWGIPPMYASIDWARAYKDFLEDWATVQRTLARFALLVKTKGGPGAIAAYEALLSTNFADNGGTQIERNPPPNVASAHISSPDTTISAFRGAGSHTGPEQARRLSLMVAAAQGLPETFYGDSSTGSLATAVSLDRPTELKFREIQQRWQGTLQYILQYVCWAEAGRPGSTMREARAAYPQEAEINVVFPAVLEHDVSVMVESWAHIATLGGRQGIACGIVDRKTIAKGMLQEVGYQDVDALLDETYGPDYDAAADIIDQRTQVSAQLIKGTDPSTSNDPETRASVKKQAKGSPMEGTRSPVIVRRRKQRIEIEVRETGDVLAYCDIGDDDNLERIADILSEKRLPDDAMKLRKMRDDARKRR